MYYNLLKKSFYFIKIKKSRRMAGTLIKLYNQLWEDAQLIIAVGYFINSTNISGSTHIRNCRIA